MSIYNSGIALGQENNRPPDILELLINAIGVKNVASDIRKNEFFRTGWRSGSGECLAVLFPQSLWALWRCLEICVANDCIIIMQAANTGLTEGSTPSGKDYDRPVLVINVLALKQIHLINNNEQAIAMPGATLHHLTKKLEQVSRVPHSVIGSSGLGATVIGGIANNSGGALVKRGPAYTELSLFAQVTSAGQLQLVNHLDINLGDDPASIFSNLHSGLLLHQHYHQTKKLASDREYIERIRDTNSNEPSRYNANSERLFEASGCAGKIAVFAVRVDTHPKPKSTKTFYVGTNNANALSALRLSILQGSDTLPEIAEYIHRDMFDAALKYGKDTFLSVQYLGTERLPRLFQMKSRIDTFLNTFNFLPKFLIDRCLQKIASLLPSHLPSRLLEYHQEFEHHLILQACDDAIAPLTERLKNILDKDRNSDYFECSEDESKKAFLHRFAAAGAAIRYELLNAETTEKLLALDIALPRNAVEWQEKLPQEVNDLFEKKFYYGHFLCYVFHQDYVIKKGVCPTFAKNRLLSLLSQRGAKYPAEHNVGHLYEASAGLYGFYRKLDPTNTFNPGIGKTDKKKRGPFGCC